jgi:hypothetical protein
MVTLLIVTVVFAAHHGHHRRPSAAVGLWVAVPHHIAKTGRYGHVRWLLRPGTYRVRVV